MRLCLLFIASSHDSPRHSRDSIAMCVWETSELIELYTIPYFTATCTCTWLYNQQRSVIERLYEHHYSRHANLDFCYTTNSGKIRKISVKIQTLSYMYTNIGLPFFLLSDIFNKIDSTCKKKLLKTIFASTQHAHMHRGARTCTPGTCTLIMYTFALTYM